jgi:hypothetical protein
VKIPPSKLSPLLSYGLTGDVPDLARGTPTSGHPQFPTTQDELDNDSHMHGLHFESNAQV